MTNHLPPMKRASTISHLPTPTAPLAPPHRTHTRMSSAIPSFGGGVTSLAARTPKVSSQPITPSAMRRAHPGISRTTSRRLTAQRNSTACSNKTAGRELTEYPFTLAQLRNAIPMDCFEVSTPMSTFYLLRALFFIGIAYRLYPLMPHTWSSDGAFQWYGALLKFIWWNWLGFQGWCLFLIGHDATHYLFSSVRIINEIAGLISHSLILLPFHAWRISHHRHHLYVNHLELETAWRPVPKKTYYELKKGGHTCMERFTNRFIYTLQFTYLNVISFPINLALGQELGNHYNPWSKLFAVRQRLGGIVSTSCIMLFLSLLFIYLPLPILLDSFVAPWIIFVIWLCICSRLQHLSSEVEYYRGGAWSMLRGAVNTIDRSYGTICEYLGPEMGCHIVHHLFIDRIPHYHLRRATAAIKPLMGDYYCFDPLPGLVRYFKTQWECHFIPDEGQVNKFMSEDEDQTIQSETKSLARMTSTVSADESGKKPKHLTVEEEKENVVVDKIPISSPRFSITETTLEDESGRGGEVIDEGIAFVRSFLRGGTKSHGLRRIQPLSTDDSSDTNSPICSPRFQQPISVRPTDTTLSHVTRF